MVKFENADVAAKYEALRSQDGKVHIPAGKKKFPGDVPVGYAGPLSKITLAAADKAYESGSNVLKLKDTNGGASSSSADELPAEEEA